MPTNMHAHLTQHLRAQQVANDPQFPDQMRQKAQEFLGKSAAFLNLQLPAAASEQKAPDQQEAQATQQAQVQAQQSAPVL